MAPYPLEKQTAGCNSPHNWLMSMAKDFAALCDTVCGIKNGTNGCHLAVFSVDVAFACHFVGSHPPPPSRPIGVLPVLAMSVKSI